MNYLYFCKNSDCISRGVDKARCAVIQRIPTFYSMHQTVIAIVISNSHSLPSSTGQCLSAKLCLAIGRTVKLSLTGQYYPAELGSEDRRWSELISGVR